MVMTPHTHEDWYQFTLSLRGTCYFTHEKKVYSLLEGHGHVLHHQNEHLIQMGHDASVIIIKAHQDNL